MSRGRNDGEEWTMQVYVGGRRSGKTERMIRWLGEGHRTNSYPFWSRVVITHDLHAADELRKGVLKDMYPGEDVYRWVFSLDEWRTARTGRDHPEVAVDNADLVLNRLMGRVDAIALTGEDWPDADALL